MNCRRSSGVGFHLPGMLGSWWRDDRIRVSTRSARLLLGAVFLAPCAAGCATVAAQAAYLSEEGSLDDWPCGSVYAGTALDLALARTGELCCRGGSVLVQVLGAIDLPCSLAADTALLPVTIPETIGMAMRRREPIGLTGAESQGPRP